MFNINTAQLPQPPYYKHRLLDELLQRRMEALEETEGEQDSLQDGFVESRRLKCVYIEDEKVCTKKTTTHASGRCINDNDCDGERGESCWNNHCRYFGY